MRKFYIVDAFTETAFGGNTAGVVIIGKDESFPADEIMIKTAAELKYSETAFVKKLNEKEFKIRYFTPAAEVELCGHATIGTFVALIDAGICEKGASYLAHTLSGDIGVDISENGNITMDMARPVLIDTMYEKEAIDELYRIMGINYEPCYVCGPDDGDSVLCDAKSEGARELVPAMVSTGLPDIMMPVRDRKALEAIDPDMKALSELSARYKVTGVHAFAVENKEVKAYARNFAPLYDIPEEAATGTSTGAMTYYLFLQGLIKHGEENVYIQGEKMGRPSKIVSRLYSIAGAREGEGVSIKVGGSGYILAKGEFDI